MHRVLDSQHQQTRHQAEPISLKTGDYNGR
jgi:hypothetical protein